MVSVYSTNLLPPSYFILYLRLLFYPFISYPIQFPTIMYNLFIKVKRKRREGKRRKERERERAKPVKEKRDDDAELWVDAQAEAHDIFCACIYRMERSL